MIYPKLNDEKRIELLNPPQKKLRMVLDTDTYNEADDQFALAYALRSVEKLEVEAVYAAPFFNGRVKSPKEGMEKSYDEILKIYQLTNEASDGKVFHGSDCFLTDKETPVISEAALDLIKRVKSSSKPLYVLAIAAITNVASAILIDPSIINNMVVVWLGGHPHFWKHTWEFNLKGDIKAAQVIFDSGVALIQIPCMGVASGLMTTDYELNHYLKGKSVIGTYLADTVCNFAKDESFFKEYNSIVDQYLEGTADYPDDLCGINDYSVEKYAYSKIIWDIATVGYVVNPNWVHSVMTTTPIITDDAHWKFDENRHPMRVCTYIKRDCVFGDLFYKLSK
ncbi:inosine-uridine nucleoside N-ribohydrolase [Lachnotalea glycerini]|uniref:Inosine-uridine nucleoside N-ribohydrolase n=1 Tax=Lachnotalea glycerini TaxID=1763509 RepID=A0A318ERR0_9FIRM|nr:nucleoside hydrolase [Lachnotalea glycerini]PXV95665.1 inosine-uridine nucleoside N-ribohydrolase [Lachnotalea glycerini]